MTETQLEFTPHPLDRWLGYRQDARQLSEVEAVGVVPRGRDLPGGVRKRLRILTSKGEEIFLVNRVEKLADSIRKHLLR